MCLNFAPCMVRIGQPLARFRKAVNKSIEQRRQILARFQDAVEQSMAHYKKKKFHDHSSHKYRKQCDISAQNYLLSRRFSSQIELATLVAGSQTAYLAEAEDLDIVPEEDMEVRTRYIKL